MSIRPGEDVQTHGSGESPRNLELIPGYRRRVPPLPASVLFRPRVLAAITDPVGVVILTAAPGYGATTAIAQAVAAIDDVRWLSLDETVSDETATAMVEHLLGDSRPGWYVIDGVVAHAHPGLCGRLPELAAQAPASAHLVISTSGRLEIPGAAQLDETLLAFTRDEAMQLLAQLDASLYIDEVTTLIEEADGWVSALVAAALRMRVRQAGSGVDPSLPAELLTRWLDSIPARYQRLLADIAVADRVCDSLVTAITSQETGLRELVDAHCYLSPSEPPAGHQGQWWRMHPMLLALLRQRSAAAATACHASAAKWFAGRGDVSRAIDHNIAAGRFPEAVALLESHQGDLLSTGSAGMVLRWYTEIADRHEYRVDSLLRAAWGRLLAGDLPGAEAAAARLGAELDSIQRLPGDAVGDRLGAWRCEASMLTSYMAGFQGDPATVIRGAAQAMDFPSPALTPNVTQMAPLLVTRGRLWSGDYLGAENALRRCQGMRVVNRVVGHLQHRAVEAMVRCQSGEIHVAAQVVDEMLTWAQNNEIDPQQVPMYAPELAQASVLLEQGNLQQAKEVAETVGARALAGHHLSDATWALLIRARAALYAEKLDDAHEILAHASELATSRVADSALLVPIGHVQAQTWMAAGDMLRAQRVLQDLPGSQTRTLLSVQADLLRTPVQARRTLEMLTPSQPRAMATRHVLLAALHAKSSRLIAEEHLRAAGTVCSEHGYRMLLAPPEPRVRELAQELADEGNEDLRWVLSAFGAKSAELTVLSRGDLQLLAVIPSRAKNRDIAAALGISVNTVKTRLRRLYASLGVTNRDDAIAVARQRGLLP